VLLHNLLCLFNGPYIIRKQLGRQNEDFPGNDSIAVRRVDAFVFQVPQFSMAKAMLLEL
jgi:hypothetical protein